MLKSTLQPLPPWIYVVTGNGQFLTLWWLDMKYLAIKQEQPLNEDVFKASVLRFFIVSFKTFYDEYFLGFNFTIWWSLNLWVFFSLPKRDCKSFFVWG